MQRRWQKDGEHNYRYTAISSTSSEQDIDMDAVNVAPGLYKKLADTAGIKILEVLYKSGDSSTMHAHPELVGYVIEGGTVEFTEKDGSKRVVEHTAGMVVRNPAGSHAVKNIGKTTLKLILFEVNRTGSPNPPMAGSMDAVKVSPANYKTAVADSMGIRVLMATYKPGQSSGMHSHPDQAIYIIEGSETEFTDKDGAKNPFTMIKGDARIITGPATHAAKNTGKGTMKVLIVEVNKG